MSEQLSIEILREKFKEAQAKGEELELIHPNNENMIYRVSAIGKVHALAVCWVDEFEATIRGNDIKHWKIKQSKQPKEDYEVLYANNFDGDSEGGIVIRYSIFKSSMTDRRFKIMRNTRTGEIVNFNEELLK